MKIIVWNSQDKCVADCRKLIRGCDVLCLLDCGQWTVPAHALQVQNGLYYWKDKNSSYDAIAWREWHLYAVTVCIAENLFYIAFILA